jgi:SOS response regulatory protein OraA/RecX
MTPERLRNIALYYCQRYVASETKLGEYLTGRIYRDVPSAEDREPLMQEIPGIVQSMVRTGLVNDREAASAKLRGALRAGYSANAAVRRASLTARVDQETVGRELEDAARNAVPEIDFDTLDEGEQAAALAESALRRARRGPFRLGPPDPALQRRDIAWLQRRGFRFDDIRKAMRIDGIEE